MLGPSGSGYPTDPGNGQPIWAAAPILHHSRQASLRLGVVTRWGSVRRIGQQRGWQLGLLPSGCVAVEARSRPLRPALHYEVSAACCICGGCMISNLVHETFQKLASRRGRAGCVSRVAGAPAAAPQYRLVYPPTQPTVSSSPEPIKQHSAQQPHRSATKSVPSAHSAGWQRGSPRRATEPRARARRPRARLDHPRVPVYTTVLITVIITVPKLLS